MRWRARYSPDGRTIATGDFNGLIKLWDAQTGALLHTFTGHTQLIWGLTFSRDGGWLASSSYDGTIRIWDVASGGVVRILTKQGQGEMGTIDFSPDGKWLLSSEDGAGVLWTLDLSQVVSRICAELPGDFTSDQRIQFNIVDQTPTCPQFTPAAEASK